MALIDGGSSGGYDPEEARRKAILDRLARGGEQTGGSVLDRAGGDAHDRLTSQPSVAERSQGDQHDRFTRPSVLERNEQSQGGAFAGEDPEQRRENLRNQAMRGFDINAELAKVNQPQGDPEQRREDLRQTALRGFNVEAELQRVNAENAAAQQRYRAEERQAPPPPPQPNVADQRRSAFDNLMGRISPTNEDVERGAAAIPIGGAIGGLARLAGPVARGALGGLGGAIARRIGGAAAPAARIVGPEAAEQAGRGFRGIGGVIDEGADVFNGAQRAAQARSAAAAARQAAGTMDDASLAAARQATQRTPLTQAITSRLGRVPTPVKVAAGAGAAAGLAGTGVLQPQAGSNDGAGDVGQQEGQNRPQGGLPQGPVVTPPAVQAPDGTATPGDPRASVSPVVEGAPAPRGQYMPVPQYGSTPNVAPAPTSGTPATSPAARPPVTQPAPGLRGGVAPIIERSGTPGAPIQGRGPRFGETPYGATPGQTPTGPTTGPVAEGPLNSEALRQQVVADLNGIAQIINAGPQSPDVMAIFASQGSKLLELIAEQEKQLRSQAEAEGRTIDPATQNTLDVLREQLGLQLKATREGLAARGILDSGITIEAEQILRKGNLSDQAKILSERLSRIQDNLNQGLGQFRQQRVQSASQFGMAGAQAQTQAELAERKRMDDLRQTLVSGRLGLGNSYASEEQAEMNRSFEAQQNDLARQSALAAKNAELAQRAGDAQAELRWKEWQAELDRENQRLVAEITQGGQTARQQPSGTQVDLSTNNVIAQITSAPDRASAEAAVQAAQGDPAFGTVDWLKVMQSIEAKWPAQGGFKWPWE